MMGHPAILKDRTARETHIKYLVSALSDTVLLGLQTPRGRGSYQICV